MAKPDQFSNEFPTVHCGESETRGRRIFRAKRFGALGGYRQRICTSPLTNARAGFASSAYLSPARGSEWACLGRHTGRRLVLLSQFEGMAAGDETTAAAARRGQLSIRG